MTTNTFVATDNSGNTATHSFNVTVVDATPPQISHLVKAEYYDGRNFNTYKETLVVNELNYEWGSGAPESPLVGINDFSIRFTGTVKAEQAGEYTFYTRSDDGVRLWVEGQQIINNWTDHGPTNNSGTVSLTDGQTVSFLLEFYERGGGAIIKLEWEGPGVPRQFVSSGGVGVCQDVIIDIGTTGVYNLLVDEVDPGYIDACGIASRVLSKTNFTCNDLGSNPVILTVADVNGNSSECTINVIAVGGTDVDLLVDGDEQCLGEDAQLTIHASENGKTYTAYKAGVQVGNSVVGNGADVAIVIPTSGFSVGNNLVKFKVYDGTCKADLTNSATVIIYADPKPVGIYHE